MTDFLVWLGERQGFFHLVALRKDPGPTSLVNRSTTIFLPTVRLSPLEVENEKVFYMSLQLVNYVRSTGRTYVPGTELNF